MKTEFLNNEFHRRLVLLPRWQKIALMVLADVVALPLCFLLAMMLRLGGFHAAMRYDLLSYMLVLAITVPVFIKSGLYRAVVRFIDQRLLTTTGVGLATAIVCAYIVEYIVRETELPRTALVIYWFIAFSYVTASRLLVRRLLTTHRAEYRKEQTLVAIYGVGEHGAQLASAMRGDRKYCPVCFFDEKRHFSGHSVAGLKVYHASRLKEIAEHYEIDLIVLAVPAASAERRQYLVREMHKAGLNVKVFNDLVHAADTDSAARSIRDLRIEDLLGRDPVPPRQELFNKCIQNKKVLVTGAGGSIGSELCRQISTLQPNQLHLLDHSEFALYAIQQELQAAFPKIDIHAHLGSVCDARLVERIFVEGAIDTVYHAAAYKHVPLVEANMAEGILNNVIGAQVVAHAAEKCHVKTCVLVSTDKAVRPTNIMGASKRITELIFQAAAKQTRGGTTFCMVRFGNVLGSSGSVVPLFQKQIEKGGPITITHKDVTRYFMLIPEAAQLVIQAGAMASGGEVFVLDMGEPVRIIDLARSMIEMVGLREKTPEEPSGDIEINIVGLRPGEKLYEELLIGSSTAPSEHPRIMCANEHMLEPATLNALLDSMATACKRNDRSSIMHLLKLLVSEYGPEQRSVHELTNETVRHTRVQPVHEAAGIEQAAL